MEAETKKTCRTCKHAGAFPVQPIVGPHIKENMICRALPPVVLVDPHPLGSRPFPVVLADEDWCGYYRDVNEKKDTLSAALELTTEAKKWSKDEFAEFKTILAGRLCWDCGRMLDYGEKCHCENDE